MKDVLKKLPEILLVTIPQPRHVLKTAFKGEPPL